MVEVKEPFIAERAAAGPARRPRRAPGGASSSPPLKREPCLARLCPGPATPWLGRRGHTRCPAAPHVSGGRDNLCARGLRAPRTGKGCAGMSLWGDAALGCSPLQGDGGGRRSRGLFAAQVALCSDGRVRCAAASQPAFAGAALPLDSDRVGTAVPTPPIRSDAEGRALAWEGAPVPTRGQRRALARLAPGAGRARAAARSGGALR